jgi:hypothetical protein
MKRTVICVGFLLICTTYASAACRVIEHENSNEVVCEEGKKPEILSNPGKPLRPTARIKIKNEQAEKTVTALGKFISKCKYGISFKDFNMLYPDMRYEIDNFERDSKAESSQPINDLLSDIKAIDYELNFASSLWSFRFSYNKLEDYFNINDSL